MFETAEVLLKQLFPDARNLNRKIVETRLKALVQGQHGGDSTEQTVWGFLADGFGDWVDAIHNYRHGQAADEPVAPSEELAVFLLSGGCTYVRALADAFLIGGPQSPSAPQS
jgi:hypothetical protein